MNLETTQWRTRVALLVAATVLGLTALFAVTNARPVYALTNCNVADFSLDGEEMAFLTLINQYRATNGLNQLTISTNLNRAAHWMSNDMGVNSYFSHTDSLGRSPSQRALDCGYPQGAGENLAGGTAWSTAQSAFVAWQNSPGHNANMLNSFYKQIGIARVNVPGSPYTWYWTTNFGATNDGTGGAPPPANTPTNTPQPQPTNTPQPQPTNTTVPQPTATPPASQGQQPPIQPTSTPAINNQAPTNTAPQATPTKTSTPAATPTKTATPGGSNTPAPSLALKPGSNLVGWSGNSGTAAQAFKDLPKNVEIVYGWNAQTKQWERYAPGLPAYVNSLKNVQKGAAYWVVTR